MHTSPICILPNSNSAGEGLDDFQSYLKFLSLGVPPPNIHWFMLGSNRVFCPRRFWVVEAGEGLPINSKQEGFPISQTQTSWALDATSQCWWLSIPRAIIKESIWTKQVFLGMCPHQLMFPKQPAREEILARATVEAIWAENKGAISKKHCGYHWRPSGFIPRFNHHESRWAGPVHPSWYTGQIQLGSHEVRSPKY